jgi:cysteine desulfurase
MLPYFHESFGNPLSIHSYGQEARGAIEQSRRIIALNIGAYPDEIVFTSGGTESNNFAIKGIAHRHHGKGDHIITTKIEHHAVLNPCRFLEKEGFSVTYLPVDSYGFVDPDDVRRAITDRTILISIMHANNEIGTIEPIAELGKIARERAVFLHTDAVQSFGQIPIDVNSMCIDLLSASSHKLYGPKGIGMLYIRRKTEIGQFMHGGEQEDGRRGSTHNVPGIVGFGKAVSLAREVMNEEAEKLTDFRDKLISGIIENIEDSKLNGHPHTRLPNNVNVSFKHVEGESILLSLDLAGISCSTGSACSFATLEPSHVLEALGLDQNMAQSSVRYSLGRNTTDSDINRVLEILPGIVARLRAMSPFYKAGR